MATVGTAVPANVNLAKTKPFAVSAYSRRVKSIANNAQSFGPDSYVNITLDTSTPGSFLDPLSSYLKFDLNITNTNVFADFLSFGNAGAASVIEEFRIYVQGTPIEEILQYNVFYELAMNQNGQCQQPFHIFRPNPTQQTVSELFHLNAIKAPMCDLDGKPMFGTVLNDVAARNRAVSWAYSSTGSMNSSKMVQSQAVMGLQANFGIRKPYLSAVNTATARSCLIADAQSLLMGQIAADSAVGTRVMAMSGTSATDAEATNFPVFRGAFDALAYTTQNSSQAIGIAGYTNTGVGMDVYNTKSTYSAISTAYGSYLTTANGILPYSGSTVEFPSLMGETREAAFSPDLDPRNPLNWSSFLPASEIRPDLKTLGPQNLQDYMMFLSNVKYIPIGMPGYQKEIATSWNIGPVTPGFVPTATSNNFKNIYQYSGTAAGNAMTYTYTCCVPLISGVLGSFAEKCWPTMLIAPGSMYIQVRTATPQKAFQLSMDPCRRVLGTIRDYLPFGGSIGGVFGQVGRNIATTAVSADPDAGPQTGVQYVNSDGATLWGCLPSQTMADYLAVGSIENTGNNYVKAIASTQKVASMINGYACIGATVASASRGLNVNYLPSVGVTDTGVGLMFRPYSVAALEGKWTIGRAYISQLTYNTNVGATGTIADLYGTEIESGLLLDASAVAVANGSVMVPAPMYANFQNGVINGTTQLQGSAVIGVTGNPVAANNAPQSSVNVKFSPSGIPLPQYWLHAQPWTKKNFQVSMASTIGKVFTFFGATQKDVASEADACYGTYLTASVPQCRRVLTHISNPSTELVTYTLSNIEFVSQQIILPDSVSAQILQQAAAGDISINANSVHNYQTPIALSDSQNLIIPAKIASANTMYCLFVPQAFVSGQGAYAYNSLRGVNPFASVSGANSNGVLNSNGLTNPYNRSVGLGYDAGQVRINNTSAGAGAFQIQLKIGNELIPQQPLTTVTELVTENVKAQHKLFDTASNVNVTYGLTNTRSAILGVQATSGLSYDSIRPESFCTTFVSAEHCDDQTAINNPAMGYVYACEANYLAAIGSNVSKTMSDYVIKRSPYGFDFFQPPSSTFVIAFDMDTWSRYNEVTRSGKFLGNNTITLSLVGATELGLSNAVTGSQGFVLQTFVVHDIRFSFQAGGSVVCYY